MTKPTKPTETEAPKGLMEQTSCFDVISERRAKRRPGWLLAEALKEPTTGKRL